MARDHGSRKNKSSEKVTLRFDVNLTPRRLFKRYFIQASNLNNLNNLNN